ncbi:hypothetical protein [Novosphingobium sp. 9]|uniref:hypothetical protein n=1 Tax=Novosphingobium sp. 9 TaxID=2025349 RepID=UPI0021B55ECC|nr:hypothetical protein [Novosphingobium sp. 9]
MANAAWRLLTTDRPSKENARRIFEDPLLATATIVLVVALVGVTISQVVAVFGLISTLIASRPFGHGLLDPVWAPVGSLLLAIGALSVTGKAIGKVLAIIATVAEKCPFAPANAGRIEGLAMCVIELAAIQFFAGLVGLPIGGTVAGFAVSVDFGGGNTLAFALVLFVLARVFRHGHALEQDVEGTV